jgi:hypothetical protein
MAPVTSRYGFTTSSGASAVKTCIARPSALESAVPNIESTVSSPSLAKAMTPYRRVSKKAPQPVVPRWKVVVTWFSVDELSTARSGSSCSGRIFPRWLASSNHSPRP